MTSEPRTTTGARSPRPGRASSTACEAVADPAAKSAAFDGLSRIREAGGIDRSPFGPAQTVRVLRGASEEFSREGRAATRVVPPPALASAHRDLVRGLSGQGSNYATLADVLGGRVQRGVELRTLYKRFVAARDAIGRWLTQVERAARERDVALPGCFRGFRDGFESNPGATVGG